MRKLVIATLTAAVVLTLAPTASADPDRSVTVDKSKRTAAWASPYNATPRFGYFFLTEPYMRCRLDCDETLVKVASAGALRLDVTISNPITTATGMDSDFVWLKLSVYRSNAAGAKGQLLASRDTSPRTATVELRNLPAGYYLAEVDWREGASAYNGKATFTPARGR